MDKSTYEIRLSHWAQVVQAANNRPQDQLLKDWLSENDISKDQYYYWQRKVRKEVYDRLQEEQELRLPSIQDRDVSFVELPVPKRTMTQHANHSVNEKTAVTTTPVAFIQAGHISIALSNDISEALLGMIIREVAHA